VTKSVIGLRSTTCFTFSKL